MEHTGPTAVTIRSYEMISYTYCFLMESRAEWEAQSVLQLVNPCWLHTAIENLNRDQKQRLDYIYRVQNM